MAQQPKDPHYDAVLERAKVHLSAAWAAFCADPKLQWRERTGDVTKVRSKAWIDALKEMLAHHELLERHGGG